MRSTKIIKNCSSSLCTCLHQMVILRTRNKITDFFIILAWASPFNLSNTLNHWLVTYDFESLYTNIHRSLSIDTLFKLKPLLNLTDELISTVDALSKFLSTHAYFHVGFDYTYKQIDGLPMGGYESVNVANLILKTA